MSFQETPILQRIRLAVGCLPGIRVFRNNCGTGWIGKIASHTPDRIIMINPRPLRAGLCTGSSDLIGWRTVTVTQVMVGRRVAQFLAIEAKAPGGRISTEQANFLDQVRAAGGIAGVAYSPDQAGKLVQEDM